MTTDEKIEKLTDSVQKISEQFQGFARESEKKAYEEKIKKLEAKEPWWSSVIKFIGLPAAIVLLVLNYKQTGNVSTDTELKKAQIENTKMLTLEKKLSLLTDSVSIQKIENAEDRIKMKKDVANITNIIKEIKEIKASNNNNLLINRFIVISLFFISIHLFMRIFSFLWHHFFNALYRIFSEKWRNIKWSSSKQEIIKKYERRIKYFDWLFVIINGIPEAISIFIDFFVVTLVIIPLFDLASSDLDSANNFQNVFDSIKHIHFIEGIYKLKDIIF